MEQKVRTPLKAIRAKCLDCSNESFGEARSCQVTTCPLYPYRLGKNPNRAGLKNKGHYEKTNGTASDFDDNSSSEGDYTTQEIEEKDMAQLTFFEED